MNPTKKYQCGECRKNWDTEEEAKMCCPVKIIDVYICGKCGMEWLGREAALLCCTVTNYEAGKGRDE